MSYARMVRALLCASTIATGSHAATVVIWPVDPKIAAGERATALWIENKGNEPVTMQVRTLRWTQGPKGDQHEDQDDIVASPPIATVPAGQRQLVRIVRRNGLVDHTGSDAAVSYERSYRLLIDELPQVTTPDTASVSAARVAVQMRYSLPLFTYSTSSANAKPELSTRSESSAPAAMLVIHNNGLKHARIVDVRTADQTTMLASGLVGYALAGKTLRLPLANQAARTNRLLVNVNGVDQVIESAP